MPLVSLCEHVRKIKDVVEGGTEYDVSRANLKAKKNTNTAQCSARSPFKFQPIS